VPAETELIAFGEQAEVLASMDVGVMWDRLKGEFLGEYARLQRQGLGDAEFDRALDSFMGNLSTKPVEDLARKSSSVAYNQGRSAEIVSQARDEVVQFVVYSSVLEAGTTCEACWALDSKVIEVGTPEYDRNQPGLQCYGGDRCRCFYIPVTEEFLQ